MVDLDNLKFGDRVIFKVVDGKVVEVVNAIMKYRKLNETEIVMFIYEKGKWKKK